MRGRLDDVSDSFDAIDCSLQSLFEIVQSLFVVANGKREFVHLTLAFGKRSQQCALVGGDPGQEIADLALVESFGRR